MYCNNCGKEIAEGLYACPYCGAATQLAAQQHYRQPQPTHSESNGYAIAGLVLAFFFPLLGLIFSCVGLSKSKNMNGEGRGLSIAGIIISAIEMAIVIIIVIAVIGAAGAAASSSTYNFIQGVGIGL